ncbi:hypothetical protein J6590_012428 [Homalodisca vitripennis]|nr:hypothetical protein J6590_012428 [Homalodisca vitripennis]
MAQVDHIMDLVGRDNSRAHVLQPCPFYRFLNILCRIPSSFFAGPLQLMPDVWNDSVQLGLLPTSPHHAPPRSPRKYTSLSRSKNRSAVSCY